MPVIGNLDGQVDDVIISPISKRRRGEEQPLEEQNEAPRAQVETPERDPSAPTQTPTAGESSAMTDELPVWLL